MGKICRSRKAIATDLFIVQVVANVIDKIPDPELQLFLQQIAGL
ncbi:hypothetical protein [uncultured Nostoc sp.]